MFTALIRIHRVLHAHIWTGNLVYNGFWKNGNVLGLAFFCLFPFDPTKFQEIASHFINVLQKPIWCIFLGASAFEKFFIVQDMDLFQNYGINPLSWFLER